MKGTFELIREIEERFNSKVEQDFILLDMAMRKGVTHRDAVDMLKDSIIEVLWDNLEELSDAKEHLYSNTKSGANWLYDNDTTKGSGSYGDKPSSS